MQIYEGRKEIGIPVPIAIGKPRFGISFNSLSRCIGIPFGVLIANRHRFAIGLKNLRRSSCIGLSNTKATTNTQGTRRDPSSYNFVSVVSQ